ncbi:dihydrolipoyl dehydrogenase [Candidatus Micrarchaeota archaeon]|nr:dihydrolipoyl dehydrogenase [Candidatus Micrarchaeota archaeon]MBU1930181.1 dihydrolipoyl dehydrogenase [Candidatus Micrarchaeota archaeon]
MVMGEMLEETETAVLGAGPGGYVAALRLGQLGKQVVLVDRKALGGVCLNQGCIPSKALIHATQFLSDPKHAKKMGIDFEKAKVHLEKLDAWKKAGIEKLEKGIATLCKKRNVEIVRGTGKFESQNRLRVESPHEVRVIEFKHAIIDTGSKPISIPGLDLGDPLIMDSEEALQVAHIPKELVIIGAGYIGIELGTVFAKLGSQVSIVQRSERILSNVEEEAALIVQKQLEEIGAHLFLNSHFKKVSTTRSRVTIQLVTPEKRIDLHADKVLIALGRKPNTDGMGLENTKVQLDEKGFIRINDRCQTSAPTIFAVGDVTGPPLLAHRAFRMGKIAAEAIAGLPVSFDNVAIPSVVFSDPEIASVGITEKEAREQGKEVLVGKFPFCNLGRAVSTDKTLGFVKIIAEKQSQVILGVQIVGEHASDMIGEASLAMEMGAQLEDIAATIHPHPTFSEAIMEAAEDALGKSVHQ